MNFRTYGVATFVAGAAFFWTASMVFGQSTNSCPERYTSGVVPPAGYGAAYDVFGSARELLLQVECNQSGDATFKIDSTDDAMPKIVSKDAFRWNGSGWVAIALSGTPAPNGGDKWLLMGATASISNNLLRPPSIYTFFAAYTCTFTNSKWNCGCRDSYCVFNGWQLQAIRNPIGGATAAAGGTTAGGTTGATTAGTTGTATGGTVGPWKLYDNISFAGEPNLTSCGLSPMKYVTNNMLGSTNSTVFDQSKIDSYATEIANINADMVVLNYENWRTGPGSSLSQNDADRMATVANTLRAAVRARGNTHAKFSFYGAPFLTRAISAGTAPAHTVVDAQDFLTVSLYVSNANEISDNSLFAKRANSYVSSYRSFAGGKPVLAYIWPQFYGDSLQFLSQDFWNYQLQTLYPITDGVFIWGTLTCLHTGCPRQPWDNTRGWWIANKNFVSTKLGASLSACND